MASTELQGSCCTRVYLVGAGPGDVGLMTVRGLELIERADCIVFDYLANEALLAHAKPDVDLVYVGKKGFEAHIGQEGINRILVDKARDLDAAYRAACAGGDAARRAEAGRGRTPSIVRLKGGDPFVFGRGGEEALALAAAGVPFEVVPGVTSGVAAPAYAGVPVTHRGVASSVTFVTGNEDPEKNEPMFDWEALARMVSSGSTLCFYMGMRNLALIVDQLCRFGASPETPVALVRWGTTPRQQTVAATLETAVDEACAAKLAAPVMIVVGNVAALRADLSWFERRALFGKRVVVTRSRAQAGVFSELLLDEGADVEEFPTIAIADPDDFGPLDRAIEGLSDGSYDWVVFTSANGVERFFERLAGSKAFLRDARIFARARVAAIGPASARAVERFGIVCDAVPDEYRAEAVFDALRAAGLAAGERVLIPRAQEAREILPELLADMDVQVDVAPAYRTVPPEGGDVERLRSRLAAGEVDAITFTSSSTVRNLVAVLGDSARDLLSGVDLFSIGPITSRELEACGLAPRAEAAEYTVPGLLDAMKATYGRG